MLIPHGHSFGFDRSSAVKIYLQSTSLTMDLLEFYGLFNAVHLAGIGKGIDPFDHCTNCGFGIGSYKETTCDGHRERSDGISTLNAPPRVV